jgi:hypothetical protein
MDQPATRSTERRPIGDRITIRRSLVIGLVAIAGVVGLFTVLPASATHVNPTQAPGNPSCPAGTTTLKVEPVADGTFTDGTLTVTIDVRDTAAGQVFDWTSNIGVDQVIAKGGNTANIYTYDPPAESTGDTGLHAPANASGKFAGLSHISFCYDGGEPPTTTPTTAPTTTTASTTTTTESTTTTVASTSTSM